MGSELRVRVPGCGSNLSGSGGKVDSDSACAYIPGPWKPPTFLAKTGFLGCVVYSYNITIAIDYKCNL